MFLEKIFHPLLSKVNDILDVIFRSETKPTSNKLKLFCFGIWALNACKSIRFTFNHFLKFCSNTKLSSHYYTFSDGMTAYEDWGFNLFSHTLDNVVINNDAPIILAADDTLVEKFGTKFEYYSTLFDHTERNGTSYVNGHCFVSTIAKIPLSRNNTKQYETIQIAHRMWTGDNTKIDIAKELLSRCIDIVGKEKRIYVEFDSWYSRGTLLELAKYDNVVINCAVRCDTALYAIPDPSTKKRGRPRIRGKRIRIDDIPLKKVKGTDYRVGTMKVLTNIFGNTPVLATVTCPISGDGKRRLFLCTDTEPFENLSPEYFASGDKKESMALSLVRCDPMFTALALYLLRWGIEVTFYELKTFWGFNDYRLRSKSGIEALLNLEGLVYGMSAILPWLHSAFSDLIDLSLQERRYHIGLIINRHLFLQRLLAWLETAENSDDLPSACRAFEEEEFRERQKSA